MIWLHPVRVYDLTCKIICSCQERWIFWVWKNKTTSNMHAFKEEDKWHILWRMTPNLEWWRHSISQGLVDESLKLCKELCHCSTKAICLVRPIDLSGLGPLPALLRRGLWTNGCRIAGNDSCWNVGSLVDNKKWRHIFIFLKRGSAAKVVLSAEGGEALASCCFLAEKCSP